MREEITKGPRKRGKTEATSITWNGWTIEHPLQFPGTLSMVKKIKYQIEDGREWNMIRNNLRKTTGLYKDAIWDYEGSMNKRVKFFLVTKLPGETETAPGELLERGKNICDKIDSYFQSVSSSSKS